ncbi:MAG: prephenate dehydrogenase/arogenate dehydrogenase family protein [Deltaproteobacteria bacterium]|nr:prephenate dehydrogenase/arogenate dehydrogenase family protein [Deltaproteobacteria bacterium]
MGFAFRRMVVAGVGLIGGSLALAARQRKLVEEVIGFGRGERNLRVALKEGMIDRYFLREEELPRGVDLLVLATPVQAVVPLAENFLPGLESGCLVSDVGSVKGRIVRDMEKLLPKRIPFVGAHPIAGSEQWGAAAAVAGLFSGQRCIVTPTRNTDPGALKRIISLWRRVGARVEAMDPEIHDRILAVVSHLPHVLAYAMVNTLGRSAVDSVDPIHYCGGGFRDFTRIAASRPELWRDICLANRRAIGKRLTEYIKELDRLKRWIREGRGDRLERDFTRANEIRRQMAS